MIELTKGDWVEIYYALETKAGKIEAGDYDDGDSPDSDWGPHLRSIMEKIGPDGVKMYKQMEDARLLEEKMNLLATGNLEAQHRAATENTSLRERVQLLEGAARADEERLIKAAEKAGMVYWGCDTPDHLADTILELKEKGGEAMTNPMAECVDLLKKQMEEVDRLINTRIMIGTSNLTSLLDKMVVTRLKQKKDMEKLLAKYKVIER